MPPPEATLEETRAALAPTLAATAALLPWLARPRVPRFPVEAAGRWQAAGRRLARAWAERHGAGLAALRPAVFALYEVALELADADCLGLAEALASVADRLEATDMADNHRLVAAVSATLECLAEADSLEHEAFPERARHFAARLAASVSAPPGPPECSPALARLFAAEARECLERIDGALAALPPDTAALATAASDLARLAEEFDCGEIGLLAERLRQLLPAPGANPADLEAGDHRAALVTAVAALAAAVEPPAGD